ncbi:MAG: hypothetical protein NVSMB14_04090 [Isosphaeraceae bacterium]
MISILELSTEEAFKILFFRFEQTDLPPLAALENEDWGRDLLLSRFLEIPAAEIADAGLTWTDGSGESATSGEQ